MRPIVTTINLSRFIQGRNVLNAQARHLDRFIHQALCFFYGLVLHLGALYESTKIPRPYNGLFTL